MNKFKSHFWYNKSQRNGIFFLAFIIIILQLLYFFLDFSEDDNTDLNSEKIVRFQREIDSFKTIELENRKPKIFPFNPSFIIDYKGYQLGMSTVEIDRLLQHRANGNYINSVNEFQQITKISDSLLNVISPYFKFPDWVTNKRYKNVIFSQSEDSQKESRTNTIQDLNSATAKDLVVINGVGEKLSNRIINYRNKLGGFSLNEQLYEVYGLERKVADVVLERFTIVTQQQFKKINVNEATFNEVLSIVYIDYQLTKKIFDYRDEVAEIQSLEELKKIEGFPLEKFDRIALYLEAK